MSIFRKWPTVDKAVDRFGYWGGFFAAVGTAMTWLSAQVGAIAKFGWAAVALAGIGVTCLIVFAVSAFLVGWRYFNPIPRQFLPFDPSAYSPDPASGAPSREAYFSLVDFAVQYLWPACEGQIDLQKAIIREIEGDDLFKELAIEGMSSDPRPAAQPFWIQYQNMVQGIEGSEPTIDFGTLVECINRLANEAYKNFCDQSEEMAKRAKVRDLRSHPTLGPIWQQWADQHNALVDEHRRVRQNARLGRKVYRPNKLGKWGDKIPPITALSPSPQLPPSTEGRKRR
jgi:hypothetical protein